jgi:POT family proton-dependent oligopeptide transporter
MADMEEKIATEPTKAEIVDEQPGAIEHVEDDAFGPAPTEEEWKSLREVADSVPKSAFLVILIEFCERFTYYGLSGPFQNYIQNDPPPSCK